MKITQTQFQKLVFDFYKQPAEMSTELRVQYLLSSLNIKIVNPSRINGVEVPFAESEALAENETYYLPDLTSELLFSGPHMWGDRPERDCISLKRNLIYRTSEDAVAVAQAMLGGKVQPTAKEVKHAST